MKYKGTGTKSVKEGEDEADTMVVDVSCDSTFMQEVMPKVGKAIREAYHWVPQTTPIYLFLDNADGHGTDEVVEAYKKSLEQEFNVICYHQRPRSPATNMLDLGVWMALQNVVEKMHFRQRKEVGALARTVESAWDNLKKVKLENVWGRWKNVLNLIIEANGGDDLIESKRGKLYLEPPAEAECLDNHVEEEQTEADEIAASETEG